MSECILQYVRKEMKPTKQTFEEIAEKITAWRKEAHDALSLSETYSPIGNSKEYWRGRFEALSELEAFVPPALANLEKERRIKERIKPLLGVLELVISESWRQSPGQAMKVEGPVSLLHSLVSRCGFYF